MSTLRAILVLIALTVLPYSCFRGYNYGKDIRSADTFKKAADQRICRARTEDLAAKIPIPWRQCFILARESDDFPDGAFNALIRSQPNQPKLTSDQIALIMKWVDFDRPQATQGLLLAYVADDEKGNEAMKRDKK
jgi:hypothetical protein